MQSSIQDPDSFEIALSPGERVRTLVARIGEAAVADMCAGILSGRIGYDDVSLPPLTWLGGRHASQLRSRGFEVRGQDYWPRVWAARGLLYVWSPDAEGAILTGLHDPAWRVREMCARVSRHRHLDGADAILAHLLDDPVARVRVAAESALTVSARSKAERRPPASPRRRRPR